jgi:hydroxyacylglutathione hydrolase
MLFERIVSKGLTHYSYLIGDKNEAIVIDPRIDCDIYLKMAFAEGMRITHILETHRNEDYLIGSHGLANQTGAQIWHADNQLDYRYGVGAKDGQKWKIARLEIEAVQTPGHTPGSMSYLLKDTSGISWVIFTGDALFAGDVGRIDLLGKDRAKEMASLLYDSIFGKLLPLGDHVLAVVKLSLKDYGRPLELNGNSTLNSNTKTKTNLSLTCLKAHLSDRHTSPSWKSETLKGLQWVVFHFHSPSL